ncbi:VanZ family protein [Kineosporia sp. A_224]|uniref:VanZ family protein n=1 Tax=Kineosporia sp. A_224 TaxID=1962180 RepID=UPI000B4AE095|nr:VanZ family protein [Kineosporia sp. A_224]
MGLVGYLEQFVTGVLRELGSLVLVVGVVAGALVARPVGRRLHRSPWLVLAVVVSLTLVAATTLVPGDSVWQFLRDPIEDPSPRSCVAGGVRRMVSTLWADPGGVLNVALFVPAGLTLTLWTRRPLPVLAALSVASLGIETVQLLIDRQCQAGDWLANTLGAAVGVGLAAYGGATRRRPTGSPA